MSSLGSSDDFFFCITASSPQTVGDFLFTYSCNPPVYPSCVVPCHSAPIRAVHLTRLPHSGHELSTSLAHVYTRHLSSPFVTLTLSTACDSHLIRHVLAAASLVWPVTLAHHLVHLGNVIRRTRLLHSALLLNAEASSNRLLLFADWVVPIVAWKSSLTRVVLLGLASCRALPLPSTPWTRAVYSDCVTLLCTTQIPAGTVVACSTGLHQTSSIDTIRPVVACIHHDVHDSTARCFASFNCASMRHPLNQLGPNPKSFLKLCTLCVFRETVLLHPTRQLLKCCEQASKLQSSLSHFGTCRCITTGTSTTQSRNCTCGTTTVFCTIWMIGAWRCITTGTSTIRSTIRFEIRSWGMIWTTAAISSTT